ncbi:MAG: hypothetical protein V3U72_00990 [Candidatus Aenigmarchaeota archaeon]
MSDYKGVERAGNSGNSKYNSWMNEWLNRVEELMELRSSYGVDISNEELSEMTGPNIRVEDIVKYIKDKVSEKTNKNEENQRYNKGVL